ncbi:HAD-like protein [Lentinula edodes]|uniref:HAD-like protein n=1 Tax=Lentinula edodes TaxID=5353 RepID=A0A1Q3EEL3_LENED|nr:HAD-like protein [Lentinula edodes]
MPFSKGIEYVLFDMDDEILAKYGKEMTWDIKAGCMGKPEKEAALYLLSFFPEISLRLEDYLTQRNTLQDLAWPTVPLLPGVRKLVLHLKKHNIPIAVATGSRRRNYEMKTSHLSEVFGCFEGNVVCGDDPRSGMRSKPDPDIFLVAAKETLGRDVGPLKGEDEKGVEVTDAQRIERGKGLVLEDGLPGMQAGKRAGMAVVWVPDANLLDVNYSGNEKADQILKSLEDFVPEEWGLPPYDP